MRPQTFCVPRHTSQCCVSHMCGMLLVGVHGRTGMRDIKVQTNGEENPACVRACTYASLKAWYTTTPSSSKQPRTCCPSRGHVSRASRNFSTLTPCDVASSCAARESMLGCVCVANEVGATGKTCWLWMPLPGQRRNAPRSQLVTLIRRFTVMFSGRHTMLSETGLTVSVPVVFFARRTQHARRRTTICRCIDIVAWAAEYNPTSRKLAGWQTLCQTS